MGWCVTASINLFIQFIRDMSDLGIALVCNDVNENLSHILIKIVEAAQNTRIQNYPKLNQRANKMELKKII